MPRTTCRRKVRPPPLGRIFQTPPVRASWIMQVPWYFRSWCKSVPHHQSFSVRYFYSLRTSVKDTALMILREESQFNAAGKGGSERWAFLDLSEQPSAPEIASRMRRYHLSLREGSFVLQVVLLSVYLSSYNLPCHSGHKSQT